MLTLIDPQIFAGLREPRKEHALKLIQTISNIEIETIIQRVATIKKTTPEVIKGRRRFMTDRTARNIVAYLAWKGGRYTLTEIGKQLGGRDYSTIINARDAISEPMDVDKKFAAEIREIERMVCTGEL